MEKITRDKLMRFLVEALCGFILWTLFLSPYVLFITKMTLEQYLSWLIMEAILVPPIAVVVVNVTNKIVEKIFKKGRQAE